MNGMRVAEDASDPNNPGVLAVESWYSWNSIDDYANNIVSIERLILRRP